MDFKSFPDGNYFIFCIIFIDSNLIGFVVIVIVINHSVINHSVIIQIVIQIAIHIFIQIVIQIGIQIVKLLLLIYERTISI